MTQSTSGAPGARSTGDAAKQEASRVADSAKSEASRLADDAKDQGQRLYHQAQGRLKGEADKQAHRAAEGLRSISSDLRSMSNPESAETPVASWVHEGASQIESLASRIEQGGIEGIVDDVSGFARRNPGTFLAGAFGVGLLAGRLFKNVDTDSITPGSPSRDQLGTSDYRQSAVPGGRHDPLRSTADPSTDIDVDVDELDSQAARAQRST